MKTSVMLEGYCADIERLVREGMLRPAVKLSAALPDLCAALEDAQIHSSGERYAAWCGAWLRWPVVSGGKRVDGVRLYRLYSGRSRMRRLPGPEGDLTASALARMRLSRGARRERTLSRPRIWRAVNRLQEFQVGLIEALVDASRRWYREKGANDPLVQRNLSRLLISR